jgi:hypothetical protein
VKGISPNARDGASTSMDVAWSSCLFWALGSDKFSPLRPGSTRVPQVSQSPVWLEHWVDLDMSSAEDVEEDDYCFGSQGVAGNYYRWWR